MATAQEIAEIMSYCEPVEGNLDIFSGFFKKLKDDLWELIYYQIGKAMEDAYKQLGMAAEKAKEMVKAFCKKMAETPSLLLNIFTAVIKSLKKMLDEFIDSVKSIAHLGPIIAATSYPNPCVAASFLGTVKALIKRLKALLYDILSKIAFLGAEPFLSDGATSTLKTTAISLDTLDIVLNGAGINANPDPKDNGSDSGNNTPGGEDPETDKPESGNGG